MAPIVGAISDLGQITFGLIRVTLPTSFVVWQRFLRCRIQGLGKPLRTVFPMPACDVRGVDIGSSYTSAIGRWHRP